VTDGRSTQAGGIESWELELISKVSRAFRTNDREELEAELGRKLLELKNRRPSDIRRWESYLAKMLYNKASNWVRDTRYRESRAIGLTESEPTIDDSEERFTSSLAIVPRLENVDLAIILADMMEELEPSLKLLWETLVEEKGNQAQVARRLGIHRNTVRLWIRKIQELLERHGLIGRD